MKLDLRGLVAAPHTPFHSDTTLNLPVVERQVRGLAENGIQAAFICGTTGEGVSLSLSERMKVAERWVEASRGTGLRVLVNVSQQALPDIRDLAEHAARTGADGFAIIAPSVFRPARLDDLVEFCAVAASFARSLPFYFYHMPSLTGVAFPMADFVIRAIEQIPNFGGIKFTSEDLMDYDRCRRLAEESGREVLFGRDEILLSALSLGAKGAIGSTYNYAAPIYQHVLAAFAAGDLATAQAHQARAMEMVAVLNRYGGLAAGKAMMGLIGIDCGPVRLPLRRLTEGDIRGLRTDMERLGVLDRPRTESVPPPLAIAA